MVTGGSAPIEAECDLKHIVVARPLFGRAGHAENVTSDRIERHACSVDRAVSGEMATDRVAMAADVTFTVISAVNSTSALCTTGA